MTKLAPIERNLDNPVRANYELIPEGYGARCEHIESLGYEELLQFAQIASIGHPYFDARCSYFKYSVVPHFNKLFKAQSGPVRRRDIAEAERLGLVKRSAIRRFGHWLVKVDRAIYNFSF